MYQRDVVSAGTAFILWVLRGQSDLSQWGGAVEFGLEGRRACIGRAGEWRKGIWAEPIGQSSHEGVKGRICLGESR